MYEEKYCYPVYWKQWKNLEKVRLITSTTSCGLKIIATSWFSKEIGDGLDE